VVDDGAPELVVVSGKSVGIVGGGPSSDDCSAAGSLVDCVPASAVAWDEASVALAATLVEAGACDCSTLAAADCELVKLSGVGIGDDAAEEVSRIRAGGVPVPTDDVMLLGMMDPVEVVESVADIGANIRLVASVAVAEGVPDEPGTEISLDGAGVPLIDDDGMSVGIKFV